MVLANVAVHGLLVHGALHGRNNYQPVAFASNSSSHQVIPSQSGSDTNKQQQQWQQQQQKQQRHYLLTHHLDAQHIFSNVALHSEHFFCTCHLLMCMCLDLKQKCLFFLSFLLPFYFVCLFLFLTIFVSSSCLF